MTLGIYLFGINLLTYALYWLDKRAARRGDWRISEFLLLLVGFMGGWPSGFLAQKMLRHKNRKRRFQWQFWLLVAVQVGLLIFPPAMLRVFLTKLFA